MHGDDYGDDERIDVCRFYVTALTANIVSFLRDKPNTMDVWLEKMPEDFSRFWDRIGASGDADAAAAEWHTRHNASTP